MPRLFAVARLPRPKRQPTGYSRPDSFPAWHGAPAYVLEVFGEHMLTTTEVLGLLAISCACYSATAFTRLAFRNSATGAVNHAIVPNCRQAKSCRRKAILIALAPVVERAFR